MIYVRNSDISDISDNNDRLRKKKYSAEKSFVKEESDVKVKKKRKDNDEKFNENLDRDNEKELKDEIEDNEIHNNERDNTKQNLRKKKLTSGKSVTENNDNIHNNEKYTMDNNGKPNLKKRKLTLEKSITETEDNDNSCNNEKDTMDNGKQILKKRKLTSEKSLTDESDTKEVDDTGNSNIEIQENLNKNIRNKSTEKKKRRLTINDTADFHGLETKSSKNKGKELEYPNKGDGEYELDATLQTEKHLMISSDVEEKELNDDERKKKRNRKKRSKIQEDIDSAMGLQVMAKPEWKHLRNRYLELQRTKMSQLKQHLRKAEVERGGMMKKRWNYDKAGQNYDKSKHEKDNGKISGAENSSVGRVSYAPGIIVKIEMDEPCTDPQSFKVRRY